ncbi:SDR family NAD(P)-dependent oxidoreductase [Actinophytocola sp. NPDC049390]|uniref:SDR family NAD(P)-dependent oxidoreductase n=1 Tax=Actinophytocola sp. NPDC049390 TaxID=3363894 RepID=UPI0037971527
MRELAGKAALVTGGSRGIGAAIASRLAESGADVAITYVRAKDRADEVVERIGGRAFAVQADNTDADAVTRAVDRTVAEFGRLDILVNNAGVFPFGAIEDVPLEEVDRTLAIHTRATFLASQAAVRHMVGGGRIVSIGSNLAQRVPFPGVALYAMSKSALDGFTKALAREVGPRGITVNVVHPGSTDTDMNPADGDAAGHQRSLIPLGHFGVAADIAGTVAFLAGPGGGYVNGAAITVDGGTNA